MFYRQWKIKNTVVLDVRSAAHLEAFLIKQGMLFFWDVLTLWNEKNQKFGIVKSRFLSLQVQKFESKFVNVMSFRYLYGCYKWKSIVCGEYLIHVGKNS